MVLDGFTLNELVGDKWPACLATVIRCSALRSRQAYFISVAGLL